MNSPESKVKNFKVDGPITSIVTDKQQEQSGKKFFSFLKSGKSESLQLKNVDLLNQLYLVHSLF